MNSKDNYFKNMMLNLNHLIEVVQMRGHNMYL